jgi:molybdenum cofactor biosynthesis enzyme MoaA
LSDSVGFPIASDEAVLRLASGCSQACTFCNYDGGRTGLPVASVLAHDFPIPKARRILIMAGDVLKAELAPLIRRLREESSGEVLVYAHPGFTNMDAFQNLVEAGITGIRLCVPAADRVTMARLTNGTGSLTRLARLIDAVVQKGLDLEIDIPVLPLTLPGLVDTARRVLTRAGRLSGIHLGFSSEADRFAPRPWDFRRASQAISDIQDWAIEAGVPLRLTPPSPPPCLLRPGTIAPDLYPAILAPLRRSEAPGPFPVCRECILAGACPPSLPYFQADADLGPVQPIIANPPPLAVGSAGEISRPTAVELHLRRLTLDSMIDRLNRAPALSCTSPWSVLGAQDPLGAVSPCKSTLLRKEVQLATGNWIRQPLLEVWNSDGMRRIRRSIAAGNGSEVCREICPVFHGGRHSSPVPNALPMGRAYHDNLVLQMQEILDRAEILQSRPTCLVIAPSLRCNHNCLMCEVHSNRRVLNEIPDVVFDSIMDLLPTLRDLSMAGAEPLMSPRFAELMRASDSERYPDLQLSMTTNGILLDEALLSDMSRARFHTIVISINSTTAETFQHITGNHDGFQRVLSNVRRLMDRSRGWRHRPRVVLSFVVMRSNFHEAADFVDLARGFGAAFRFMAVERDYGGESVFTDEKTLRESLLHFEQDVRPRAAGLPAELRHDVAAMESILRRHLERRDFRPL